MMSERDVNEVLQCWNALRETHDEQAVMRLISALRVVAPPGIEWALEIGNHAGMAYLIESGKLLQLRVSREEFGPFMDTSVREISAEDVPKILLSALAADAEGFMRKVLDRLQEWSMRAPTNHPSRPAIEGLLRQSGKSRS